MTPTRARGLKLGLRQTQVLRQMARSGGRWPHGWVLRNSEKETMFSLVKRGWVVSLDTPVLTPEGRKIAYWL